MRLSLLKTHIEITEFELENLRLNLVETAMKWEWLYGNAPSITSAISEFDAAMLVGFSAEDYSKHMQGMTSVQRGYDFIYEGSRYQVKANRPSGKKWSFVTLVPKAKNYEWDYLIWILYNPKFEIQEAWLWDVDTYKKELDLIARLSPKHYRQGKNLLVSN